jgi:hypothetical protein
MVGGAGYLAGKSAANHRAEDQDQEARIADLEAQQQAPPMRAMPPVGAGLRGSPVQGRHPGRAQGLRDSDVVRLVDVLVVRKDEDGNVEHVQRSDLTAEEAEEFGATVGALIGFGPAARRRRSRRDPRGGRDR